MFIFIHSVVELVGSLYIDICELMGSLFVYADIGPLPVAQASEVGPYHSSCWELPQGTVGDGWSDAISRVACYWGLR